MKFLQSPRESGKPAVLVPRTDAHPHCISRFTAEFNREAFSITEFERGKRYKLILTGICQLKYPHHAGMDVGVDALYREQSPGNYITRHFYLRIDMEHHL